MDQLGVKQGDAVTRSARRALRTVSVQTFPLVGFAMRNGVAAILLTASCGAVTVEGNAADSGVVDELVGDVIDARGLPSIQTASDVIPFRS